MSEVAAAGTSEALASPSLNSDINILTQESFDCLNPT